MSGLEEFYKKHSLANILTICFVITFFGDYFYLQVGKVFYVFSNYLPLIIACLFGWKANLVALFPLVCSYIYEYYISSNNLMLSSICAIVLTNLSVSYLATTNFFKNDLKRLLLFEIGTLALGVIIYGVQFIFSLTTIDPLLYFNSIFNFVFIMVMLILINAKQNEKEV